MGGSQLGPDSLRLKPLRLAAQVLPLGTVTLTEAITQDATLVFLRVRIYRGAGLALHISLYVQNAIGQRRNLIRFAIGGKQYLDGDDDVFEYGISEPVDGDTGEVLYVVATNADTINAYDFAVDLSFDLSNGQYPGVTRIG